MNRPLHDRPTGHAVIQTARHERLLFLLALVGPGPTAFYRDALRALNDSGFETGRHLVSHCFREIESSVRGALLPERVAAGDDSHKRQVRAILERLEMSPESESAVLWLQVAAREDPLHREAHRNALMAPRPLDESFREHCDKFELLLLDVLTRFEGAFCRDDPAGRPARGDRRTIEGRRQALPRGASQLGDTVAVLRERVTGLAAAPT